MSQWVSEWLSQLVSELVRERLTFFWDLNQVWHSFWAWRSFAPQLIANSRYGVKKIGWAWKNDQTSKLDEMIRIIGVAPGVEEKQELTKIKWKNREFERIRQRPVTDIVLKSRTVSEFSYSDWCPTRDLCKVFESRTVADVPKPWLVLNIWKSGLRDFSHCTRRQSRIFDGHCTRV